jgi:Flp pilus assembly protein TadD
MAACLVWLAGCESTSKLTDPLSPTATDPSTTGSVDSALALPPFGKPAPATPEVLGRDPHDDLSVAKKYYRQGSHGLAERHFRRAVELHPHDAEAWVGLAGSYDWLRRFDLSDRAYAQAIKLVGATPEILNNQGFSYMLRGDYRRARALLLQARAKAPDNAFVRNNLLLLEQLARKSKAIN